MSKFDGDRGCGISSIWFVQDSVHTPACVEHDLAYERGFSSYRELLQADLKFIRSVASNFRRGPVLALVAPPVVLAWGAWSWFGGRLDRRDKPEKR